MNSLLLRTAALACLLPLPADAQSLVLDGVGTGPAVNVSGGGGPPGSSVELFRNGVSLGSVATTAGGQFSFPNVAAIAGDSFQVAAGQVWNFDTSGNREGWNGLGDISSVSAGVWKQTETASGSDMALGIYGNNLIRTKARALEIRMRFHGKGSHVSSLLMQTAGPDGQAGGGDDPAQSVILNTVTLQHTADFQTFVFDLGVNHAGQATNWLDPYLPISLTFYIPGTNTGDVIEVDSIRLTESLRWEFNADGDLAEWLGNTNTSLATTGGLLQVTAQGTGPVAMFRPFRNIGSTHFHFLETRLRQVTGLQPNLFHWAYFSNPANYQGGGFQIATPATGSFQTIQLDLAAAPLYGNAWGAGGAATMNVPADAFNPLYANTAGDHAEIDFIRLHPAERHGPSAPVTASDGPVPPTYHVSSSAGSDFNSGRSAATPWKTFANLDGLSLGAGARVLLRRGDTWPNQQLRLTGKGVAGNPITLSAYGEGRPPRITGINLVTEPCLVWDNASHVRIDSLDCRDAKVGLYLRYTGGNIDGSGPMFRNTDVQVTNCHFQNMDEPWSDANGNITVPPPYELSWGAGIWLGGTIPAPPGGPWPSESSPILDDFSVTHCGFERVSTGVGMNFYFPSVYHKGRFTNFRFEDCWVTGCENGSMALFYVDGGHAKRVDTFLGGSGFYATGTTAGFIQHSRNFLIENCQFAFNQRNATGNDGTGFDYEGNTENVSFLHNVIHDNDGSGMLLINSEGGNGGFDMSHNTFWNNCRKPKEGGQNNEMRASAGNSGTYTNNGIFRGAATSVGTPAVYNNTSLWTGYTGGTNNRTATAFAAVGGRPSRWGFDASVEGWGNANQWSGFTAAAGALVGTSSGGDPYVESATTWANSRERRWVHVRMSQTAGTTAQVFFQTEPFPSFSPDKAVAFPIVADGTMRDYLVELNAVESYRGVITKWRLDPTDAAGSTMAIDRFEPMLQPCVVSVTPVSSQILDVRFSQAMHPDGGVFETANYQLSGLGQGTAAPQPDSVTVLATEVGPVCRLVWSGGHTNGLAATLAVANATDARGNLMWNDVPFTFTTLPMPESDSDGDGMPDEWETANGLQPGSAADAQLDADGDGRDNLAEYHAATDPRNPASCLAVSGVEALDGTPARWRVKWRSTPGMAYQVETSDSMDPGSWTIVNESPAVATMNETAWDLTMNGMRKFVRIRAIRPNPMPGAAR